MTHHLKKGGMPLRDTVGVNCKKCKTIDIKAQVLSILGKG